MKEGEGICTSGKKKASVRKETDAASVTRPKIVHKNQNTLPPRFLSHPSHEVEVRRGREVSEAKVTMGPFWRTPLEHWHPTKCQFYTNETGCKSGDTCLFPHYKVDEQPNKRPKKGYLPKRRESEDQSRCGYCEKRFTVGLSITRLGCTRFSRNRRVSGKPDAGSLGTKSKGTIHSVHATSSKYPGKERTIVGKIQVKVPHQQCSEDQSQEETERQQRCARSKAWNLAKNIYKLKANDKAAYSSLADNWVLPSASAREPEEREFVVDSGGSMHVVSETDRNSLETMRTSRCSTTVRTATGEVRRNKEATVCVKQLDFFVTVMLLQETPAVLSLGKLCEDHGYAYHWKSGQKPHLIKKGKKIDCKKKIKLSTICGPWFVSEFFLHHAFTCLFITGVNIG